MKKLILSLLVIASVTVLTNKAYAQYAIPSFDVPVIADPTTFEEVTSSSYNATTNFTKSNTFKEKPTGRERRKLNVTTIDNDIQTTAWASIEIYSLDGNITYGPYTVYEGAPFEKSLSEAYEWGVRVLSASESCEMSVWYN